jgi:MscS family membrane protein
MNRRIVILSFIVLILSIHDAHANQILKKTTVDTLAVNTKLEKQDPFGRSYPKGTVNGFFSAIMKQDYLLASQYIDFSEINKKGVDSVSISLVKKFEIVLNKYGSIIPKNLISDSSDGDLNDGLDPVFEEVGSVVYKGKTTSIFLELIQNNNNHKVWLFSKETLKILVEDIYSKSYSRELESNNMFSSKWQGAPLRDWLTMILLAVGSYLVAWLFTILTKFMALLSWRNFNKVKYSRLLKTLLIPFRLILAVLILLYISRYLGVSILVRQAFGVVNLTVIWMAVFIFVWLLINTLTSFGEERLRATNSFGGLSAISFFRNTAKFSVVIIAILIVLDTFGVNVTAGLAALGVGGLALALGAQKTIENIVGGLSVVFDQPVSVGDFCKFGETLGTVEKIGMRSTRIRTLNRTIVTIPNSDFSSRLIENYSKRDMFLYQTTIGLRYETSSDQMRYILVELRKILYAHPKIEQEPARVRFLGYGSDALKVELFAYAIAKDWNEFLGIQEDLNLRLVKVIEDSGSGFAFPSQTVYLSKDQGLSETKKEEVENKVKKWIENNELKIPEFDEDTIKSLKGSITYPNKGTDISNA